MVRGASIADKFQSITLYQDQTRNLLVIIFYLESGLTGIGDGAAKYTSPASGRPLFRATGWRTDADVSVCGRMRMEQAGKDHVSILASVASASVSGTRTKVVIAKSLPAIRTSLTPTFRKADPPNEASLEVKRATGS